MFNITGTYTDKYQLTMAQVYFLKEQHQQQAVFDYFFRKLPFSGGYAILSGIENLLSIVENLHFDEKDLSFLKSLGFHPRFLDYLKTFRFQGHIFAPQEGDVVFPYEPVITIEANIIEAQIIETLLLNIINFQTLIATKARRMRHVAGNKELIDFGLRRAQGLGGYYASRAAMVGGFDGTSNVYAACDYQIPLSGTMSHAFVQSYDDELTAFRDFARIWPEQCVLLVDTYDTQASGLPNAIKVAKELEQQGHQLQGIRLDSGDLAKLAELARKKLDEEGLNYVKIAVSNQLDEFVINALQEQKAPIDIFGVGTNLVIGRPDAALDGVYKLAYSNHKPRIKLSENKNKITIPLKKQVYRLISEEGQFYGTDVITLFDEKEVNEYVILGQSSNQKPKQPFTFEALLKPVMRDGKRLMTPKSVQEIAQYSQRRFEQLPLPFKSFQPTQSYEVSLSPLLKARRDQLIETHQKGAL